MTLFNFFLVIANILVLAAGIFLIKRKIEKMVIKKEVLQEIKQEVNQLIVKLNETTLHNINLVEDRVKKLDKLLKVYDRKAAGLDIRLTEKQEVLDIIEDKIDTFAYSPQKIVKQTQKMAENQRSDQALFEEREIDSLDEVLKDLNLVEKVKVMSAEGYSLDEIRKYLGISSGEFELIINMDGFQKI